MPRVPATTNMPESAIQLTLAKWLDHVGILWFHPVNGAKRSPWAGAQLKLRGLKAGVPDIIILSKPPKAPSVRGVAIELKAKGGRTSAHQDAYMRRMRNCEWLTRVCFGSDEAIEYLQGLGYGPDEPDPED